MDGPTNDKEKVYRLVLQSYFSLVVFLPKPQHFTGQHKEHNQRTADSSEVTKTALQTASSIWTEAPCQGEFTTSLSVLTDRVPCLHALLSLTSWEENYTALFGDGMCHLNTTVCFFDVLSVADVTFLSLFPSRTACTRYSARQPVSLEEHNK